MKNQGTAVRLMVAALQVLLAAAVASADDPKKPAAIAASTTGTGSGGATATGKPAAVQASTGKPSFATHLEVLEAYVPLRMRDDGIEVAQDLEKISVTVMGHDGVEATIAVDDWEWVLTGSEADGFTALQILVEQKYFKYEEGIGFVPTSNYKKIRGIKDDSGPVKGNNQNKNESKNTTPEFMGAKGGPDISSTQPLLVDPAKTESVAEDPSQQGTFGGLFGADFEVDEKCMAGRSKMYSDCTERCKKSRSSSEEYGDCVEKCSKDSLAAWGECPAPARTRADEWE